MKTTETLRNEISEQYKIIEDFKARQNFSRQLVLSTIFQSVLTEGTTIRVTGDRFSIERIHPEYSYPKEICTGFIDKRYGDTAYDVSLNYYSTSTMSDWETDRVITLGKVFEIYKQLKTVIRDKYAEIDTMLNIEDELNNVYSIISHLEAELKANELVEKKHAFNQFIIKCKDGLEFIEPITIQVNRKKYREVEKIQITSMNNKSYVVSLTFIGEYWDSDKAMFVDKEYTAVANLRTDHMYEIMENSVNNQR